MYNDEILKKILKTIDISILCLESGTTVAAATTFQFYPSVWL